MHNKQSNNRSSELDNGDSDKNASRDKKDMMLDGQVLSFAIMDKYPDLFVKAVAKDLRFQTDKQNVEAAVDLFSS